MAYSEADQQVIDAFHRIFYANPLWRETAWRGVQVLKNPLDLFVYAEIMHEVRPDLVIETGTCCGGSAHFFADMMRLAGDDGDVLTIDTSVYEGCAYDDPMVTYLHGSSLDQEVRAVVATVASEAQRVLVVLDSDHGCDHVLAEMDAYGPFVTPGSYLIVEDGNVNGHPVTATGVWDGPYEAVERWLPQHPEFVIDAFRERFLVTYNPHGYLKRLV